MRVAPAVRELCELVARYDDVARFVRQAVRDGDDAAAAARGGEAGVVSLMTMHMAKGREFEAVFLTGWEEGIFPMLPYNAAALAESGAVEDERRLACVICHVSC